MGEVVLDDLVRLRTGDQVPADGVVSDAEGLEIDESLLTGESDPVDKAAGDQVLSGSIVVAGAGTFQATAVGADAYAHRLAIETKRFTKTRSELMAGIDTLLRYITWGLIIIGPILLISQLTRGNESVSDAIVGTVAALVGMVPEGLVLLTSIAFFVAALNLARRKVLVQELPAVEGLARVDVVCLDKTGTLTDGTIRFAALEPLDGQDGSGIDAALGALADDPEPQRHPGCARGRLPALCGLGPDGVRAVLLGPEVERCDLRRPGQLGAGSTRDRARRLRARHRCSGAGGRAVRLRATGAARGPCRRAARGRDRSRTAWRRRRC